MDISNVTQNKKGTKTEEYDDSPPFDLFEGNRFSRIKEMTNSSS